MLKNHKFTNDNLSKIKGIPNLGNTCYSSVMLQLLFSSKDLVKLIYKSSTDDKIILSLKNLIDDYFFGTNNIINDRVLTIFYYLLGCPTTQQDASEYLEKLLNIISNINDNKINKLITINEYDKDIYREIDRFKKEYILNIPLLNNLDKKINFNKNIWNNYFKNIILLSYPKYFFINISRNDGTGIKLNNDINNIWMEKKLTVDKYTNTFSLIGKSDIKYKLIAFGVHIGNRIKSGHWICYKLINNNWFYCSDSTFNEVDNDIIKTELKQASILLYEKIEELNIINENENKHTKKKYKVGNSHEIKINEEKLIISIEKNKKKKIESKEDLMILPKLKKIESKEDIIIPTKKIEKKHLKNIESKEDIIIQTKKTEKKYKRKLETIEHIKKSIKKHIKRKKYNEEYARNLQRKYNEEYARNLQSEYNEEYARNLQREYNNEEYSRNLQREYNNEEYSRNLQREYNNEEYARNLQREYNEAYLKSLEKKK